MPRELDCHEQRFINQRRWTFTGLRQTTRASSISCVSLQGPADLQQANCTCLSPTRAEYKPSALITPTGSHSSVPTSTVNNVVFLPCTCQVSANSEATTECLSSLSLGAFSFSPRPLAKSSTGRIGLYTVWVHTLGSPPSELQWPVLRHRKILPFYVETNFKPPRWLHGLTCLWLRSKPDHLSSIS